MQGQDADCNPSTVGGILGTIIGYDKIPAKWLNPYKEVENITLNYTDVSLSDCYNICYNICCNICYNIYCNIYYNIYRNIC